MIIKNRSARVIVRHENGNLLLVYNTKFNVWEFPGGSLEPGETYYEAATRELEEEAGFTVRSKYLNELTNAEYVSRAGNLHRTVIYWTSRMTVGGEMTDPSKDKNIREVGWMNTDNFPAIEMHPFSRFAATLIPQAVEERSRKNIDTRAQEKSCGICHHVHDTVRDYCGYRRQDENDVEICYCKVKQDTGL